MFNISILYLFLLLSSPLRRVQKVPYTAQRIRTSEDLMQLFWTIFSWAEVEENMIAMSSRSFDIFIQMYSNT